MNKYAIGVIIFVIAIFCVWFSLDEQQANAQPQSFEINPLIDQNRFIMNGIQQRFFVFHRNVEFDRLKTPVENMMMIMQSMNSFNLCDETWLVDMQFTYATLKEQYLINKYSLDPGMQELMKVQLVVMEKLDLLIRNSDSKYAIELETAFGEYLQFYEESIKEGGVLHEVSSN